MSRGRFITFEGGEGAGKSTQMELLRSFLNHQNVPFIDAREPGGTEVGMEIRQLLLHRKGIALDPRAEALLYAADRAQNINTRVRPALEGGITVVQDRYLDSSVAYQAAGRVLDADDILGISKWATESLMPDLTILLDIDPIAGRMRKEDIRNRTGVELDRLESEEIQFHVRVREAFLDIARRNPDRFLVVDAELPIGDISDTIQDRVAALY